MRYFALGLLALLLAPVSAFAQLDGALVSCLGPYCQLCDLMVLLNNIIRFAVAFSVVVATLMFVYAGALYVTSAANEGNIKKAHGIFSKVFIGLVIILVAWLVIDLIMKVFLSGSFGPWNDIECAAWPSGQGYTANLELQPFSTPLTSASSGSTFRPSGGSCSPVASGPCSVSSLTPVFGANAEGMSQVCQRESGGNPNTRSGSDVLWCGTQCPGREGQNVPFSFGIFQNNIATDEIFCPAAIPGSTGVPSRSYSSLSGRSGVAYNCASTQIWNPPTTTQCRRQTAGGTPYNACPNSGWGKTVRNWDLYDKCVNIALNTGCSIETARVKAVDQRRGYGPWALARSACNLQFQ